MMRIPGAVLALAIVLAATSPAGSVEYGFEVGAVWASQTFDCKDPYEYETDPRVGPWAGLFAEFELAPRWSVDVGLHLTGMGMQYDWKYYSVENRLWYLSVPVLARARIGPQDAEGFLSLSAGPRVDIMLSNDPDEWFEPIYEDFETVSLGADLGAGVEVGNARLELRYSASFTDLRPDDSLYKITNHSYSIVYSLKIPGP
jgi:hypothetical protein